MPDLGRKYTCYSCHTKFYDLGKPVPLCPKCGADQRDADEAPVYTTSRSRAAAAARVVEEPVEDEEFTPAASGEAAESEEDEEFPADAREEEADDEEARARAASRDGRSAACPSPSHRLLSRCRRPPPSCPGACRA